MHCLDVQMELQAYVDEELSPEQHVLLGQHLAGCDGCRAELARLQAVVTALETWPLVAEPAQLTARVMAQVKSRPALPAFRLHWSDLAISLVGAGLASVVMLAWRYVRLNDLGYLYLPPQVHLRWELLRLEGLLLVRHLARTGSATWGLVLVGAALALALAVAVWGQVAPHPIRGQPRVT